jgi:hypothetical protein
MKLGLLADIHEQNHHLRDALERFQQEDVDQVVVLGDVLELGERIEETCNLLTKVGAVGVWGNHDYGVAFNPDSRVQAKYSPSVLEFMTSLHPRLEIDGCLFTHVEPWLNAESIKDLWYFDGPPDTPEKAARSFEGVPHQFMFVGHFHRWLAATSELRLDWNGETPLELSPNLRYLIVVAAVCNGSYGTFNTETRVLTPMGSVSFDGRPE